MIDRAVAYALGVGCLGLAALSAMLYLRLSSVQVAEQRAVAALATERAERAQEREKLVAEALASSEAARALEARWRAQHTEVQTHAQNQIRAANADAARARDAADILRQRAEVIGAQCAARSDAGPGAPAAAAGQAAASPGTVLADVLGRLAQTAGELAAIADARGAAGTACEKAYEALR
jgi:hypothetical protein